MKGEHIFRLLYIYIFEYISHQCHPKCSPTQLWVNSRADWLFNFGKAISLREGKLNSRPTVLR